MFSFIACLYNYPRKLAFVHRICVQKLLLLQIVYISSLKLSKYTIQNPEFVACQW